MTAGWGSRTVRAAVFAAVCVLLAALGHVLMSGRHVPAWAMAVGLAATAGAGWCLAGRERGLPVVVVVVVAAQTALHSAFSLAQPTGRAKGLAGWGFPDMSAADMWSPHMGGAGRRAANMGPADMGGADMGSMPMNPAPLAHMDVMPMNPMDHLGMGHMGMDHMGMDHVNQLGHSTGGGTSSLGMLAAHLLAALLCGLWLAHGERAAFRVLRAVGARLAAPLRLLLALPTPPHRPRPHGRRRHEGRAPRLLLLVHAITSRGPPPGTAVV
ncbi:hypothetical protein ACIO93_09415 [Streptomyces sp. NPDC087903]|uniref:hypothetical protein n=1 Tax=Streptomyces sp. NPDC087903 TaxID=3365819 RepID=UPI0038301EB6